MVDGKRPPCVFWPSVQATGADPHRQTRLFGWPPGPNLGRGVPVAQLCDGAPAAGAEALEGRAGTADVPRGRFCFGVKPHPSYITHPQRFHNVELDFPKQTSAKGKFQVQTKSSFMHKGGSSFLL